MGHQCLQSKVICSIRDTKTCLTFEIGIVHLKTSIGVPHAVADVEETVEKAKSKSFVLVGTSLAISVSA